MCLHVVENVEKVASANTQDDYETTSKKWTGKKKADVFIVFCTCV